MEVFCPPQFALSSTEHGRRLENAGRQACAETLPECEHVWRQFDPGGRSGFQG